jgi:hypothetical protein
MPSISKKQHNFMAAVANNPAFSKKVGVPGSVGKDFISADKAQKGTAMATKGKMPPFMGKDAKAMKPAKKYAAGGSVSGCRKSADGVAVKGKTHCKQVKMASGGSCK